RRVRARSTALVRLRRGQGLAVPLGLLARARAGPAFEPRARARRNRALGDPRSKAYGRSERLARRNRRRGEKNLHARPLIWQAARAMEAASPRHPPRALGARRL